jgi:hypothetical protein
MNPTRRLFLRSAAFSAVAARFPLSAFTQELLHDSDKRFDPEILSIFDGVSRQTFEPWIGSLFRVSLNNKPRGSLLLLAVDEIVAATSDEPDDATVVRSVNPHPISSNRSPIRGFSLRFRRVGNPLPQDSYMLSHDWLGDFPLFVVPSGLPGAPSTCTATFTLLNPTSLPARSASEGMLESTTGLGEKP